MPHSLCARSRASVIASAMLIAALLIPGRALADTPLGLAEARELALAHQPALTAQRARTRASEHAAVSAGQLPDPELMLALDNLEIEDPNPWRADAEPMAMTAIGIAQAFPHPAKRRLAAERERRRADLGEDELAALAAEIVRETRLAWLAVWQAERAITLTEALNAEVRRQLDAALIGFRAGRLSQAVVVAARMDAALIDDALLARQQQAAEARARLARWVGSRAAARPLPDHAPPLGAPLDHAALSAALAVHPLLASADTQTRLADTELALAEAQRHADWRLRAGYAYREPYGDLLSVQVGVDLPWFTANRQDRDVSAARETLGAEQAQRDDAELRLRAEFDAAWSGWQHSAQRLARYDDTLLPAARLRVDTALADYRTGNGDLAEVLAAQRAATDLRLQQLDLQTLHWQYAVTLLWLAAGEPA